MYDARIKKTKLTDVPHGVELKISIKRTLNRSTVRMMTAAAGIGFLVYAMSFLPGLFFFTLPGMVALLGKVYDEARLIQFLFLPSAQF